MLAWTVRPGDDNAGTLCLKYAKSVGKGSKRASGSRNNRVNPGDKFFNLYNHDFARVAVGIPALKVADPAFNSRQTVALMKEAAERHAVLALFPELGLTAYTCDDLFQQRALLDAAEDGLREVVAASRDLELATVVGMPVRADNLLFNCTVVVNRGAILGVVPKTYLPNYREF